jgi:hypothetical protein
MKRLLIITAVTAIAAPAQSQNTTYGGGNASYSLDGAYVSDYSPGGTIVLTDGSVSLSNNATYEHGNTLLQNSGSWVATSGSLDLFLAPGTNTISGSTAPSFYNVNFNNGAGNTMAITNTQGIQIASQVQFSNGITTTVRSNTSTGALHFGNSATYTGGNSDARHVDGYVSKAGTAAFTFPVGSGTDLRTLIVTAPAAAAEFSTAWFAGNPGTVTDPSDGNTHSITTVAAPLQSISQAGFWDWIPVSGSDDGITITVSIPDIGSFATTTNLRLAGWNGTEWIDLSGSATASGTIENSTLSGTIPAGINITAIGIGSTGAPLPVVFSQFEVHAEGCKVQIRWSTAQERNNDYFILERSTDGGMFREIARVGATGNSSEPKEYQVTDTDPAEGLNYYRIQQVDMDGKQSSTVIKTTYSHCEGNDGIQVFPTVSSSSIRVLLPTGYEDAMVEVLTTLGRKVAVPMTQDNLSYSIRIDQLAPAIYIVRIRRGTEQRSYKIIRED